MQRYPLATQHMGVEYVTVLDHVVLSTLLRLPGLREEPLSFDVTVEPHGEGWRLRSDWGFIGYLDAEESAEFPELARLRGSGVQPVTLATVEMLPEGSLDVAVLLGLGPWMVAHNDMPEESVLLRGGVGAPVDLASGELTQAQVEAMGTEQLFVSLHLLDDAIIATADLALGQVRVPEGIAPQLSALLSQAASRGASVVARAYAADGRVAVDLPTFEDPAVFTEPVPRLSVPAPAPAIPPVEVPSETWETGLAGDVVAAPAPSGTRSIASPAARFVDYPAPTGSAPTGSAPATATSSVPAPSHMADSPAPAETQAVTSSAPAESEAGASSTSELARLVVPSQEQLTWRQLPTAQAPGSFSSESARVRARRSERDAARRRGGHHRK
ncbi:hypothetical protein [Corynebacterium sp.]|uniref:hypothetical protein n=1 Tax=Corynebacterium sp. TaxID=1720 RepID=UPI0026DC3E59|nr:hypothetical protein [Corynebacterium sp.]MDO5032043.1 hypothetical protein [Corynebacterium sp.]